MEEKKKEEGAVRRIYRRARGWGSPNEEISKQPDMKWFVSYNPLASWPEKEK